MAERSFAIVFFIVLLFWAPIYFDFGHTPLKFRKTFLINISFKRFADSLLQATSCRQTVMSYPLNSRAADSSLPLQNFCAALEISRSAGACRPPVAYPALVFFREDDVGVLTLSSGASQGRIVGKTVREDDVVVLTLSSGASQGQIVGKTVREDDVGVLTLSSVASQGQIVGKTVREDDVWVPHSGP
jgi:hypothetical protein